MSEDLKACFRWPADYVGYAFHFCRDHPINQWPAVFASAWRVANLLCVVREHPIFKKDKG